MLHRRILKDLRKSSIDDWIDALDKDNIVDAHYKLNIKLMDIFEKLCDEYLISKFNYSKYSNIIEYDTHQLDIIKICKSFTQGSYVYMIDTRQNKTIYISFFRENQENLEFISSISLNDQIEIGDVKFGVKK